jgi:hypothetical protein
MTSIPGITRGRSRKVAGKVSASFQHGIWIINFIPSDTPFPRETLPRPAASAAPSQTRP